MRITERDAQQRQLTTIFIPQEPRRLMPSDLAEEIILTHPVIPWASSFNDAWFDVNNGANGAVSVLGPAVSDVDHYIYVFAVHMEHNDVTARDVQIELEDVGLGTAVSVRFEANWPANRPLVLARTLMYMSGMRIRASVNAIAAGSRVRIVTLSNAYLLAEQAPTV